MARAPSLASADREAVRRGGFPTFIELAGRHAIPGGRWVRGRHHTVIAVQFERLYLGDITTLLVTLPPGHQKSTLLSVLGPAWIWTIDPTYVFSRASYTPDLSGTLAQLHKDLCESAWYRERWGEVVIPGEPLTDYSTTSGGWCLSTSVRKGQGLGRHCNMYIVDDPLKAASTSTKREAADLDYVGEWYETRVVTRAKPGPDPHKICVVQQRLHERDLPGQLLEAHKDDPLFEHLCLPFYYEAAHTHASPHDWRTEGETLWPAGNLGSTAARYARAKGGVNGSTFRAHYQQDPLGGTDRIFDASTFGTFEAAPPFAQTLSVISVDPTFTAERKSDNVAIEVWGYLGGHFWCYYSSEAKRGFADTLQAIRDVRALYPATHILIEASGNGCAILETLSSANVPGLVKITASKGKEVRARAASHHFAAGVVHFDHAAPWYAAKARALVTFPLGAHDDSVDTTTQAIHWLAEQYGGNEMFTAAMATLAEARKAEEQAPAPRPVFHGVTIPNPRGNAPSFSQIGARLLARAADVSR